VVICHDIAYKRYVRETATAGSNPGCYISSISCMRTCCKFFCAVFNVLNVLPLTADVVNDSVVMVDNTAQVRVISTGEFVPDSRGNSKLLFNTVH